MLSSTLLDPKEAKGRYGGRTNREDAPESAVGRGATQHQPRAVLAPDRERHHPERQAVRARGPRRRGRARGLAGEQEGLVRTEKQIAGGPSAPATQEVCRVTGATSAEV